MSVVDQQFWESFRRADSGNESGCTPERFYTEHTSELFPEMPSDSRAWNCSPEGPQT